jgi:hypothetical protein
MGKKVKLLTSDFETVHLKSFEFDKVVSFNVNFFWKDSITELQKIHQCLKPEGKLFIFYQAPYEIDIRAADPIKENLGRHAFEITDTILKSMKPTSAICIVATAKSNTRHGRTHDES